jgi:hypothetical protein
MDSGIGPLVCRKTMKPLRLVVETLPPTQQLHGKTDGAHRGALIRASFASSVAQQRSPLL